MARRPISHAVPDQPHGRMSATVATLLAAAAAFVALRWLGTHMPASEPLLGVLRIVVAASAVVRLLRISRQRHAERRHEDRRHLERRHENVPT